MCARRFLIFVFIMILLVVAGAVAIFQFGGNVLIRQATPKGHFEPAKALDAPNYAALENWLARPGLADDPSSWRPQNDEGLPSSERDAAVFFVHPTTYLLTDRWNASLRPGPDSEFRSRLFVQSQASAFASSGAIWAPRYRQAAFGAFLLNTEDAQKALDLAYADVAAAFDKFVRENPDGPIIIAGHSQGALHVERLLREQVAGKDIARRVAAAYVVGWPISTAADLPALGLPACARPDQARCVISWMTFGDPPNPDFILRDWEKTKGYNGGARRRDDALCVNPINGVRNGAADASANPGALIPTADLRDAQLQPGAVGARCERGLLLLDRDAPALGGFVLPGNNFHAYDYALFWGAVRRDAERRLKAWRK